MDVTIKREAAARGRQALSAFIRARREHIIAEWEAEVRKLPIARDLERLALIDQIPPLLERIADMADEARGGKARLPADLAEVHAVERLDEGFDLDHVVTEYAVLRDVICGCGLKVCGERRWVWSRSAQSRRFSNACYGCCWVWISS